MRKLYYYSLCGFSRTVLLLLSEKKLDFTVETTKFWDRSSTLLELNPFGRLPVLVDLNGTVIRGVYAITEYLEEAYSDARFLGEGLTERADTRSIAQHVHEDFATEVSIPLVFERDIKRHFPIPSSSASSTAPSSAAMRQIRDATNFYLRELEELAERRNWLAGELISIADLAAAGHLSVVDYLGGIVWKHFPALMEWYMRIKSRPSFKRLLIDRVPGLPPVSYYSNLDF